MIELHVHDMDPDVTVIIPTRNRWNLLKRTLGSALGQQGVNLEVIVVDDSSTDETPLELARVSDTRLRVIQNANRQGVAATRNRALDEAAGKWVAFLDDDDLWSPTKLSKVLASASERRDAAWAYSAAFVVNDAMDVLQVAAAPDPSQISTVLLTRNAVPGGCSNVVAEAALVRTVGGFDTELSLLADWDLWIRLALAAPAASCAEALVAYVRHPGSMVRGGEEHVIREVDRLAAKHRNEAAAHRVEPDLRRLYRYFARSHRRAGRRFSASRMYVEMALAHRSPGDLLRAGGVLLGERVLRTGAWTKRTKSAATLPLSRPAWLAAYRTDVRPGDPSNGEGGSCARPLAKRTGS